MKKIRVGVYINKKEACREASFVEVSSGVEPLYTVLQTVT